MSDYQRYAVYWTPERGSALARFGAEWLGWDAEEGVAPRHPDVPGLPVPAAELTAVPRHYGFHATLKAPFRLRAGETAHDLANLVATLAAEEKAFMLPQLEIAALGPFLALVPSRPCPKIDELAARCVRRFDEFRAAMDEAERKRRIVGLDAMGTALLDRWGYPFVFERFRFHLTLTGSLTERLREETATALFPVLAPILAQRQRISEICLFGEPEAGPFRLLRRFPFGHS